MDLRIKVLLQGGHLWQFSCDEDDPVVFGLISALPGAGVDTNLPPDGLVQIETRRGERLFLTRSSLVSVEIARIAENAEVGGARRLIEFTATVPEGMSGPSPFVLAYDALPGHIHRALLEHALAQNGAYPSQNREQSEVRELGLGGLTQQVALALRSKVEKSRAMFRISESLETHARFRLFAIGDTQAVPLDTEGDDVLRLVYQFHRKPKMFTGGGIRLFDTQIGSAKRTAFRDLEVEDNSLLIFPADVVSAGLPFHCEKPASADGPFVVSGTLRRIGR